MALPRPTIAAYYFPNWHADAAMESHRGRGWTEWDLLRAARPRWPGHAQPKVPLWGHDDEADPANMARRIDAAADHGVDVFLFDWYWHDGGPALHRALDEGFLNAPNRDRIRFACMWANHDWIDLFPAKPRVTPERWWRGEVGPAAWQALTDRLIELFAHPNHWRIDGRPYFSVYELFRLVASFGGVDGCRRALDGFRDRCVRAGVGEPHLNAVVWGVQILPGERQVANPADLVERLGFSSITSYVWVHHVAPPTFPVTDHAEVEARYRRERDAIASRFRLPYHPNVTMGWDPSPRTDQTQPFENLGYPHMATIGGNTPERFSAAVQDAVRWLDADPKRQRIITINAWNEWTEGSHLEPDTVHGFGHLQALRSACPPRG